MASSTPPFPTLFFFFFFFFSSSFANLQEQVQITWGDGRAKILNNGELLTLSLDNYTGSGFQSYKDYLFASIDLQMKLVQNDSAGTVAAYYLSSQGNNHDEIDFEFLGNVSGQPYVLHTNVFSQGKGGREQRFFLWFDPTTDFHTYSIRWNPSNILFLVDGVPIREFKNMESEGVAFPKSQAMKLYCSLWNADDWATRGGLDKTDWTKAPFTASFRKLVVNPTSSSSSSKNASDAVGEKEMLDSAGLEQMKSVHKKYMIYNYCDDSKRFPQGVPKECTISPTS